LMPTVLALAGVKNVDTMQGKEFSALLANPQKTYRDMIFAEQHDHGFPINKQAVRSANYLYIRNIGENKTNCILEVQPMGKELYQAFVEKRLTKDQAFCFVRSAPPEELYDVKQDPLQLKNLATDPTKDGIKAEMKMKLDAQVF
jgi:N-sulfoglucosamine sulfohydrolase